MPPATRDELARSVELRPLLAGLAVLALALAMLPAWGFYRRETLLAAVAALLAGLAACVLQGPRSKVQSP
ncbi:MAG TPA: hypothetical protein VFA18_10825, partial [Gemmataceae bacterium]|nr:hypothetical protein [Gemmataceae bacterium]